ncbi:MAG TPA: TetR/AcrR family transcriptional regulator [Acidimicrobiales bacterium]
MTASSSGRAAAEAPQPPGDDRVGVDPADADPARRDPAGIDGARELTPRGRTTRNKLVAAAWEIFSEKPYQSARITEIAGRAGVATGSFYSYFPSKEALFRVVADRALAAMYEAPRRDPDNTERDPVRDIAYASRRYFLACREHRVIAQSIEQLRSVDDEIRLSRRGTLLKAAKRSERWIRRLQDDDICDPTIDPWLTALALQSMNVNLAYDQFVHRDDAQDVDALVAAVTPIWARAVGLDRWL